MSALNPVNADGAYFVEQIARNDPDVFAVLGLHADLDKLSMRGVRNHFRKVVMPHVFERSGPAATRGPRVPTWAQVNQAKDECLNHGKKDFEGLKVAWSRRSVQVWNPFAAVGSREALLKRNDRTVPADYFAPDVEEVADEHFANPPNAAAGTGTENDPFWCDRPEDSAAGSPPDGASPSTPRTNRMQSPSHPLPPQLS